MAAGVTDRLWEMVDVVDVLDAFEAKRKRARKPIFEVEQWAIGGGYYVRATLPDGAVDRIEGFATEGARRLVGLKLNPSLGCMNARAPRMNRQP
jgi:hypothetical protein